MCDTTFTFGQRGSHFFQSQSRIEQGNLPLRLENLFDSLHMQQIYHVALGHENSFLLTWRDTNDQDHINSAGLPAELVSFLYARTPQLRLSRNIPKIRCVLGPYNDSYFAHDSDAYVWMNLPSKLLSALESKIENDSWSDRPRVIALGASDNFVLLTEKHEGIWDLRNYNPVSQFLHTSKSQRNGLSNVHNLVLHSHRYQSYVAQTQSGTLIYENLPPPSTPGLEAMIEHVLQDTKITRLRPLSRGPNSVQVNATRRPSSLQQRASLRREWSEHSQEFSVQRKGMKVSLSLSVTLGGLERHLGNG